MERFSWRDAEELTIDRRYRGGVRGYRAWMRLVHRLSEGGYSEQPGFLGSAFDDFLAAANEDTQSKNLTCRLFVSHRMNDVNNALHIAWGRHAKRIRLLARYPRSDPRCSDPAKEILIAAIIEIALLNVTHVLAMHTSFSAGSKWIPYELGRAKTRLVYSDQAAGWYYPSTLSKSRAEYMHLARETTTDAEIQAWLSSSRRLGREQGQCVPTSNRTWKYGAHPPPLDPP